MKKITLIMLIAIAAMSAKAYTYYDGIEIGNFRYNLALATSSSEESKATLQGLSSAGASATSLKIAGYVTYDGNRYRVASIATNAFQYKTSVTSVELGYGVQKIGNNAFKGCESLSSILLPSSITEIGTYAFQNCTALVFVRVAGDVAPAIQDNTFNNSSTTKRVSTATYRGMNALKADSKWVAAFGASNIKRHNGIATYDFISGNLYYVIKNGLPYNGTSSDPSKRSSCVIVGANLSSNTTVTINSSVSNTDNNAPGSYRVYGVADSAFMNNSAVTEVKCNYNQASRIGESAFRNCTGLTSAEVTADTVGNYAFYACSNLTSAALNKDGVGSVEYLGSYAFGKCALTGEINIPVTTKYIGFAPFYYCTSLTEINVDKDNTNYSSYNAILYNKDQTVLIQIPGSWEYMTSSQTRNKFFPETVQRVLQYAAAGSGITQLYLYYNLKQIDQYAFFDCKSLKTVHLPSSVTTVASTAFKGCTAINRVELNLLTPPTTDYFPEVTDKSSVDLYMPYGSYTAYANSSIWSQYNRKTGIYDHTNCWDICGDNMQLYYTVTSDTPYVNEGHNYDGSVKLIRILAEREGYGVIVDSSYPYANRKKYYEITAIGPYAGDRNKQFFINYGAPQVTVIEENAFRDSKIIRLPGFSSLEHIGDYAFYNATLMVTDDEFQFFPNQLQTIGKYAFYNTRIKRYTASATLTSIGEHAFDNCSNLHELFLSNHDSQEAITCGTSFFGGNADDFKCYVDYRRLPNFINSDKWDGTKIYPHLYLNSNYQSFSCIKPINFQDITGLTAYYVTDYKPSEKKAYLVETNNIAANNGCVVNGEEGKYYRLDYATNGGNTSSWMVGTAGGTQIVNSDNTTSYFKLNATKPVFNKVTTSTAFERGYAYLKVPTSQTGGATTIITNLSGSVTDVGDVNGDGKVNVSDVTALINMILGMTTMDETRADVNGDGKVNVSDVTALINIILGIS